MASPISAVEDDCREMVIRPTHRLVRAASSAAVLAIWVAGGPLVVRDFLATGPSGFPGHFLFGWLVSLWLVGAVALVLSLAWAIRGASVVSIRSGELTLEQRIASTRIGKPSIFAIANVHDIRIERRRYRYRSANAIYAITCDYQGERCSLLSELTGEEAHSLLCGPLEGLGEAGAVTRAGQ